MNRRALIAAACGLAVAELAGGCGASALSTSRPPKAISPASRTVLIECGGRERVRPAALVLACGDAGDELAHLVWRGWGGATATAIGSEIVAVCVPSCVAGKTATLPVRTAVSGLALQGTEAEYKLLIVRVTSGARLPSGVSRTTRYTLGSAGPLLDTSRP